MAMNKQWFHDKDDTIVLFQPPNVPIIVWIVASLVAHPANGTLETACNVIAFGSLFVWAWLELFQGVNYFRRGMGAIILALIVFNAVARGGI